MIEGLKEEIAKVEKEWGCDVTHVCIDPVGMIFAYDREPLWFGNDWFTKTIECRSERLYEGFIKVPKDHDYKIPLYTNGKEYTTPPTAIESKIEALEYFISQLKGVMAHKHSKGFSPYLTRDDIDSVTKSVKMYFEDGKR